MLAVHKSSPVNRKAVHGNTFSNTQFKATQQSIDYGSNRITICLSVLFTASAVCCLTVLFAWHYTLRTKSTPNSKVRFMAHSESTPQASPSFNTRRDFICLYAILRSVDWQFVTDVSRQNVIPSSWVKKHKENAEKLTYPRSEGGDLRHSANRRPSVCVAIPALTASLGSVTDTWTLTGEYA